ncbi:MAG: polyphosphate polymerase domain-containing protein [Clostridiaceae bacterium]|nr:polyphosphate polymerase domain-containing protein [Eubacteriales bacterium]
MKVNTKYRHELKYYLNRGDYELLSNRLRLTLEQDRYAKLREGEYFIRSLYFDDIDDSAFREKLAGENGRDKYRLRIYNMKDDVVKLERKHKENGYILKESLALSRGEAESLIAGDYGVLLSREEPFARRMYRTFTTSLYKPRVLVDYTREAYTFSVEDVRVTFDKNVRTGFRSVDLFNPNTITYPAVSGYDMVLEVKFNRYLPTYVRALLQVDAHARSAISKYCLCRKYEL